MRMFVSAVLATTLIASSAFAADGTLAPGKPAGVKQAQMTQNEMWIALGISAAIGGAIIGATSQSHTPAQAQTTTVVNTTAP